LRISSSSIDPRASVPPPAQEAPEIVPAIKRGIAQTKAGKPALLEFITCQETRLSKY